MSVFLIFLLSVSSCFIAVDITHADPSSDDTISAIESRYVSALVARDVVHEMQSKQVSSEMKARLLERVRPEDKTYVMDMLVRWSSFPRLTSEFDALILKGDDGSEILRMKPDPERTDVFEINGRLWIAPLKGSVVESLSRHLKLKSGSQAGVHLFERLFVEKAEASRLDESLKPAFIYYFRTTTSDGLPSAGKFGGPDTHAYYRKPSDYLAREPDGRSAIRKFLDWLTSTDKKQDLTPIQCRGKTATGQASVAGSTSDFESRSDGTLLFSIKSTTSEKGKNNPIGADRKTYILKSKQVAGDQLRGSDPKKVDQLLKDNKISSSDPRYTDLRTYLIARQDRVVLDEFTVELCTVKDCSKTERGLSTDTDPRLFDPWKKATLLGLRPLGACCGDKNCLARLERDGVKFSPKSKSGKVSR